MSMRDDAVYLASQAFILTAPVGSPEPSLAAVRDFDPDDPDALPEASGEDWSMFDNLGHTDLEEDIEGDEEGGDSETRGTRQRSNLREYVEPTTEFITIRAVQFNGATLRKYYGGGKEEAGKFRAPATRRALELAVLILYIDGSRNLAEYHARASIRSGGSIARAAENFMGAPLRVTPLASGPDGAVWINEDLFFAPTP